MVTAREQALRNLGSGGTGSGSEVMEQVKYRSGSGNHEVRTGALRKLSEQDNIPGGGSPDY